VPVVVVPRQKARPGVSAPSGPKSRRLARCQFAVDLVVLAAVVPPRCVVPLLPLEPSAHLCRSGAGDSGVATYPSYSGAATVTPFAVSRGALCRVVLDVATRLDHRRTVRRFGTTELRFPLAVEPPVQTVSQSA